MDQRSYRCGQGHHFDRSRSGYVNLLVSQHKKSRHPGDADEMVLARQRFLEKGYYQALAQTLGQLIGAEGAAKQLNILDLGCGEGYYLQHIMATRRQFVQQELWQYVGIDISKRAIHEHAKRRLGVQLAVASAKHLPFEQGQFDLLLSIFAPIYLEEAARVLNQQGILMMVGPGKRHLQGLMQVIYTEVFEHEGNFSEVTQSPFFQPFQKMELEYAITIAQADILDLLMMTPYYWHTPAEIKQRLANLSELQTPVHFEIQLFRKK